MNPLCPMCDRDTDITQPAEPDVGIMTDLFGCADCNIEFYIDENDKKCVVDT